MGFGGGFSNKTELLYLLKDPDLKEGFKKVMAKLEIGKKPGRISGVYHPNFEQLSQKSGSC